jgi:hypothetical protein
MADMVDSVGSAGRIWENIAGNASGPKGRVPAVTYQMVVDTRDGNAAADVSIILPVFRAAPDALLRQIGALLSQLRPGVELIVVDDGSADGTLDVVRRAVTDHAQVAVLAGDANSGVAAARNAALRVARGEFVWFVDWDDQWASDAVARLSEAAAEARADIVVCRARSITPGGPGTSRMIDGLAHRENMTGAQALRLVPRGHLQGYLWSKLIRRSLLADDPFPPMRFMSDFAGFVPALARAERVTFVPDVLYSHVAHPGSISTSREIDLGCKYECLAILRSAAAGIGGSDQLAADLRRFEYRRVLLGTVLSAIRLDVAGPQFADVVATARGHLSWAGLAAHLRLDVRTSLALGFVKLAGRWSRPPIRLARAARELGR